MSTVDGANVKKTIYLSLGRIDFCTKMVSFLHDSRDYDAMDTSCASSTLLNSSHSSISTESSGSYGWATNSLFEIGNGRMAMADNIDIWKSAKPHKANDAAWEAIRTLRCKDGSIGLKHFKLVRRLGSGDIGNVYLCQLRNFGNCMFAMKVVDKEALAYRDKLHRAEIEKQILSMLDHPFLPTLYAHFDASHYSCVVMEFCPGGDLHSLRHRQRGKRFSLRSARFYAAEVLLALEYLHMMGVIFRDLKPENVLVRADGHIMLSDFDLSLRCDVVPTVIQKPASVVSTPATRRLSGSRRVSVPSGSSPAMEPPAVNCIPSWLFASSSKKKSGGANLMAGRVQVPELVAEPTLEVRSRSFVGTHEYLAPEVTSGEGHGSAVDWWTFGVFLFELLYGKTPFKGSNNEKTLLNIVTQPLKFPVNSNRDVGEAWDAARDLIRRLLAKDPNARLGSNTGSADIKSHPFFNGVNWALIRSTVPPEIPGLRRTKTCYERKRVPQSVPSHFDYF